MRFGRCKKKREKIDHEINLQPNPFKPSPKDCCLSEKLRKSQKKNKINVIFKNDNTLKHNLYTKLKDKTDKLMNPE